MLKVAPILMSLAVLVSGCAEMTSVYHNRTIEPVGTNVVTVDAYQRNVIFHRVTDSDLRICAEAAPDTFAALSASLAAQGSVVKKEASLASAISQAGATIERTQTINLLRESMYRTCERYLSGAVSRETFIVQAARDQRTMLAVLAIEQLTRVAQPKATVISAGGTSASTPNPALVEMAAGFKKDRDAAQKVYDEAKTKFDKADATGKCSTVATQPADDSASPKKTDWDACKAAQDAQTARKGELDTATKRLDQTLAMGGGSAGGGATTATTSAGPNDPGGGGGTLTESAITRIAEAVTDIANAPGIDEAMMFCISYLSPSPQANTPAREQKVTELCLGIVRNRSIVDEKLRAGVSDFNLGDVGDPGAPTFMGQLGDRAGPVLSNYLRKSLSPAERKRRRALASAAAKLLDYPSSEVEVGLLILSGDFAQKQALLAKLEAMETDPAGKKDLAVPAK